jgi:GNAT superfamily N-acetyltransferase
VTASRAADAADAAGPRPDPVTGAPIVRAYREADAARCCAIIRACLPQLDGLNDAARALLEARLVPDRLDAELAAMDAVVCEAQGEVVGLAALDGMEAKRVYVHPDAQGRGIARVLFQHVEDLARSRGLCVLCGDSSPAAAPFYEKMGFVAEGKSQTFRGDAHFTTVRVFKRLVR